MINWFKRKKWWLILVLLPLIALLKPYLAAGVPYTHDGENHLARFANYKVALREGQLPPRFGPNLLNHYGYPVFNFNYPLLNILSLPFSVIGLSYELTFKILMVVGLLLGGWGVVSWLKLCGFPKMSRWLALAAYLLAPFTINLIYVRGNIGEVWAMALLPWLLWLSKKIKRDQPISWLISVPLITAFMLSHNLSVLFGGALWLLYTWQKFGRNWTWWKAWLKPTILAGLLSLWFWLPAMAEKSATVLDSSPASSQFSRHFVQLPQLLFSTLQFGYSTETAVDSMSLAAGWLSLIGLSLITLYLLKYGRSAQGRSLRWLWFFVVISWGLLFLQTGFSDSVWRTIPLVSLIQFPWRLSLFFVVFTLPLVAQAWLLGKFWRGLILIILIFQLISVWRLQPIGFVRKQNLDYDLFSETTSTFHENTAKDFTYKEIADWTPEPRILSGQAEYQVEQWTGSSRRYTIMAENDVLVAEPTMYFPGWQTKVNSVLVTYAPAIETEGRIGYRLPAGQYTVETRFTQQTWPRLLGNSVSVLAFGIWLWLIWQEKRNFLDKS